MIFGIKEQTQQTLRHHKAQYNSKHYEKGEPKQI